MTVSKRKKVLDTLERDTPKVYDGEIRDSMIDWAAAESVDDEDAKRYAQEFGKGEDAADWDSWERTHEDHPDQVDPDRPVQKFPPKLMMRKAKRAITFKRGGTLARESDDETGG